MLQISPLGHSCFQIADEHLCVVTDPFDKKIGALPAELRADVVTAASEQEKGAVQELVEVPQNRVFDWPGEYEVAGVQIRGLATSLENTIFVFRFAEMSVAHLGNLDKELSSELVDQLGQVDVLLLPVGGAGVLDAKLAKKTVDLLEPRVVVPMHFADEKIRVSGLAPVTDFLREMGKSDLEKQTELKLKKTDLPVDGTQVIWLQK